MPRKSKVVRDTPQSTRDFCRYSGHAHSFVEDFYAHGKHPWCRLCGFRDETRTVAKPAVMDSEEMTRRHREGLGQIVRRREQSLRSYEEFMDHLQGRPTLSFNALAGTYRRAATWGANGWGTIPEVELLESIDE